MDFNCFLYFDAECSAYIYRHREGYAWHRPRTTEPVLSPRTKAIIAAHILGYPSRIDEIRRFANENNLLLIEDASHAPGAQLANKKIGTFGDISVFSLHQRKAISTGDGGMICTNNEDYAEKMRRLRSFGDNELSYNYRMTEFWQL